MKTQFVSLPISGMLYMCFLGNYLGEEEKDEDEENRARLSNYTEVFL